MMAILVLAAGCFAPNPVRQPQDLGGEHVSFTTSDGVLLRGHLYGTGSTGVILAHMYPADQSDWTDFAQVLAAHGYQALTFDFRGFTESEGTIGHRIRRHRSARGLSVHAPARLAHFHRGRESRCRGRNPGAAREDVAGIICISTPTSFGGLAVTESIRHVRAPILFVTSADDPLVGGQPEILYRLAVAPKSIEVYPGQRAWHCDPVRPARRGAAGADASLP